MRYLTSILFFILFGTSEIFGQCCAAGNPIGGDGLHESLTKNQLRVYSLYRHSLSKDYFFENKKIEVNELQKSFYDFINMGFSFGVTERFTVVSDVGYFITKKQELLINNNEINILAQGFGDLNLAVRYSPIRDLLNFSQLSISLGTKIPIGNFNETQNGVVIPISLQPSSGALKYNIGVFYGINSKDKKFGFSSLAFAEFSNQINKDFLVYKYGNYFQFSLSGTFLLKNKFLFITNLKYEYRTNDQRENNQEIESTGGTAIFLSPQIQIELVPTWVLAANYELPIYKNVNGYQLTNKLAFSLGIIKNFKHFGIRN